MATAPFRVRAGTALLAFVALFAGHVFFSFPAQSRSIVGGLWLGEAVSIALPALAALLALRIRPAPYLGLRAPTLLALGVAVLVAILNQPVVSALTYVVQSLAPESLVNAFDAKNVALERAFASQTGALLLTVTLAAPLGEELFFRGFAQPALSRSMGVVTAALFGSALFALIHLDPIGFVGLWEIGLMLAALRHWSGSLWPAVLAHAVNNLIAGGVFVAKVRADQGVKGPIIEFLAGLQDTSVPPPWWVLALGAALGIAFAVLGFRALSRPSVADAREEPAAPGPARAGAVVLAVIFVAALIWGTPVLLQLLRSGALG